MKASGDRRFDWVAALAVLCGAAVVIPGLAAFAITLVSAVAALL